MYFVLLDPSTMVAASGAKFGDALSAVSGLKRVDAEVDRFLLAAFQSGML
jgi:hypothetical protein